MRVIKASDGNVQDSSFKRRLSFSFLNRGRSTEQNSRNYKQLSENQINNQSIPKSSCIKNTRHFLDFTGPEPKHFDDNSYITESLSCNKRDRRSYSISRSANIHNNFTDSINKSRWSCFLEDFQNLISTNDKSKTVSEKPSKIRPSILCCEKKLVDPKNCSFTHVQDNSTTPTTNYSFDDLDSPSAVTPTQCDNKSKISSFICLQNFQHIPQDNKNEQNQLIVNTCDPNYENTNYFPNKNNLSVNSFTSSNRPKSANFDSVDLTYGMRNNQNLIDQGFYEEIRDAGKTAPPLPQHTSRRRNQRNYPNNCQNGDHSSRTRAIAGYPNNRPLSEHLTGISFDNFERTNSNTMNEFAQCPPEINNNQFSRTNPSYCSQLHNERNFNRCTSEVPDFSSKYRSDTSDWLAKILPYKLNNHGSTFSMSPSDFHDPSQITVKGPTRRIPRQSLAQRNIMTQSMIAYIPDAEDAVMQGSYIETQSKPNNRFSRTISTDRYSCVNDTRPSLPSLAHLMSKNENDQSKNKHTPHQLKEPASPDFLRDQKSFLIDVESRADSPRLDQYYRLFHVKNGSNASPQTFSRLVDNEDYDCKTLRKRDSNASITKRPSRPTFVRT